MKHETRNMRHLISYMLHATCFILIATCFMLHATYTHAGLTNCDLCGSCEGKTPPSSWENCRACLYPTAMPGNANYTREIDPITNEAPTPYPGHYYTMIGCFTTNTTDFTQPGALGSVTQRLLTIVLSVSGGIAFLYLLYGSFLILTSQAEPERLNQGKRTVLGAIIGVVFVLMSLFLINFIASILKIPGFGG